MVCNWCGEIDGHFANCNYWLLNKESVVCDGPVSFVTKDSGQRQEFSTGMVRDVQTDKPRYDLLDRAMLKRWAGLMARGAQKYGEENWRKAETEEEMKRFKSSAMRHLFQWLDGETDEDHAAAVLFNVSGAEMVKTKLERSNE